jgi:hypothetical protein
MAHFPRAPKGVAEKRWGRLEGLGAELEEGGIFYLN